MKKSTCKDVLYESVLSIINNHAYSWTGIDKSNINDDGKDAIIHIVEMLGPKMICALQEEIKEKAQYMMMDDLKGTSYGMSELTAKVDAVCEKIQTQYEERDND